MATNGADTIVGTLGDDVIDALGGRDTIYATQGHDSIDGGSNLNDRIIAALADATRFADPASASRTYTITNNYLGSSTGGLDTTFVNVERVTLELGGTGDFGDTIDATAFTGGYSLDLRLGNGNDIVFGGAGNETIYGRGGINWIDAGAGTDIFFTQVDFAAGSTVFVTGSGNQVQTVHNGIVTNTVLNAETLSIGSNVDLAFDVDGLTHTVDASAYTGSAQILFYDHNGNDVFIGSSGADLFANLYNATIGDDTYTGNGGADIYDYTVAVNALNHDVITDFDADDTIDFRFNDGASVPGQLLCNSYIGAAAFSGIAGQYRYAISGNQTLIQIDTDGDAAADRTLTIANGAFVIAETYAGSNVLRLAGQVITGTAGADILTGTLGDDIISSGGGLDTIHAGDGADLVVLNLPLSVSSTLDGGLGVDTLVLTSGLSATETKFGPISEYFLLNTTLSSFERLQFNSTADNGVSALLFYGGFVSSQIGSGLSATAELIGGEGFDVLALVAVGSGSYTLPAGLTYTNWQTATNAWLPGTGDLVALVGAGDFNYTLTAANGNPSVQSLQSGGGNDTLIGSTGMDFLSAGGGSNTVSGGAGNDAVAIINTYVTGQAPSTLTGANSTYDGGADTDFLLIGGYVNFQGTLLNMEGIYLQPEFVTVASSDDNQAPAVLEMSSATMATLPSNLQIDGSGDIIVNLAPGIGFNGSGYQLLAGSNVDFTINGTIGNDTITGTSGDDVIFPGGGIDTVNAGDGNDEIVLDTAVGSGSVLNGGGGFDTLVVTPQATIPYFNGGTLTEYLVFNPTQLVSIEAVRFESRAGDFLDIVVLDYQRAISGLNTLIGGDGRDIFFTIVFTPGSYTMPELTFVNWNTDLASPNNDFVILAAPNTSTANFTLNAREGLASIQGLRGGQGNDILNGSSGSDSLDGRGGVNQLYGNGGDDWLFAENYTVNGVTATNTFAGNFYDGGADNDLLLIGGAVNFQGTLANIESIYFQPARPTTVVGAAGLDAARLTVTADVALGLPANLNLNGTGTLVINLSAGQSFNGSAYAFRVGSAVNVVLNGSSGNERIVGTVANDQITGGDGNDILKGLDGDDLIDGGVGTDRAGYWQGNAALGGVTVSLLLQGTAQYVGSQGWDTLVSIENVFGTPFADVLTGDGGNNWLSGSEATIEVGNVSATNNDLLDGQGGNDLLSVGIGNHTLIGGIDNDTVWFTENGYPETGITVSLALQGTAQTTGNGSWTLTGIENLTGGIANDTLTGDGGANVLGGGAGNDTLIGGAGNDVLYGDGGIAVDANGNITTFADVAAISGTGIGADVAMMPGASGNDMLEGGDGDDILWGGGGTDTASYASASGAVQVSLYNSGFGEAFGAAGYDQLHEIENITGSVYNDSLTGNGLANVLAGGDGGDTLRGGGGNDALYGGNGSDFINGGNGDDLIDGGDGIDRAAYFQSNAALGGITVSLLLQGTAQYVGSQGWDTLVGIENVSGTAFADTITGDAGDNWLWGSTSWLGAVQSVTNNDTIDGGGGNDLIWIGSGNHSLTGGTGSDTVRYTEQGAGAEVGVAISLALQGGAQNTGAGSWTLNGIENLIGGIGNDQLTGDGNANVLTGGSGNDELVGDAGFDQASYAGNAADFAVLSLGGGAWRVSDLNAADGDEGVDLILGIEQLRFADQLVTLNEAPVATSAIFLTDEDVVLGGQVAASDLENIPLTFQLVTGPANGTLSFNPDGTFIYTPGADFFGADSFTFTASDGTTTSNLATANLTIAPVDNDPATIGGQLTGELTEGINPAAPNGTVAGQLTATDPDGPTSFTAASQAGIWGAFTVSAGGSWSYELADNDPFIGALTASDTVTDSFTVTTADGSSNLVTVTIHGANDAAVIGGTTSATVIEAALLGGASQVAGTLTISDIDSPAQFVAAALVGLYGTLTLTAGGSWTYVLNNANPVVDGLSNGDSLSDSFTVFAADGTAQLVTVTVSGSDDIRTGTNNADNLIGTTGSDTLNGNNGNDTLNGGLGNDVLNGGNGIDTATYAGLASGVSVSLAISTAQNTGGGGIDTLLSIENLTGTSQADVLTGNASNNTLTGGDGNDVLNGGAADDILNGGNGTDTASYGSAGAAVAVSLAISASQKTGGAGSDTLTAIENLIGSGFADTLTGSTGANRIEGGVGNDRITGGGGGDQLFGGSGNDTFAFLALGDSLPASPDTIFDFAGGGVAGGDLIDLAAIDAIPGGRDNAFAFIGSAAFSGVSGQLRFDTAATPGFTLVQGDTNGDGVADFQMQLQWSDPASQIILNAQDFIL